MNLIRKICYIFDKKQKINLVILFIVMFIGGFVELLGVSAILPLVDVITNPDIIKTNELYLFVYQIFNMKSPREFVLFMTAVLIFIYIFKNLFIIEMNNLQFRFTYNNQRRVASRLMSCYMQQDYLYHVARNTAILQRNITQDVGAFFATILYILQALAEIIVCVMLGAYLLYVDFATTMGVIILIGSFSLFFYAVYKTKLQEWGKRYRQLTGLIYKWAHQSLSGIKEIKILNKENYFLQIFDTIYDKNMRTLRMQKVISLLPKPLLETVCICGLLGVIAIRVFMGADLSQFVSTLSVFALAAFRMLPSFNRITTHLSNIMFSKASVDSIYNEIVEAENNINKENNLSIERKYSANISFDKEIVIENLQFKYPESKTDVINDLSLKIAKNQSVAFIGSSGSGKTTLVDLILGVLRPNAGAILCDRINIWDNIEAWHKRIGYIPQTIYLMDDTIRNNIAFGVGKEEINEEQIWAVLRDAQLEEFVKSLPNQLDTEIGEKGVKLSGGQRQRIGIARALYHNPEVLVMDEATSALDNDTEQGVMDAINGLSGKKTIIIVAHRLTTIVNCDVIYEVVDGGVREVSHEKIIAQINQS